MVTPLLELDIIRKRNIKNLLTTTDKMLDQEKILKEKLDYIKKKMKIVGWPFDNHEAELYALDKKINYTELELMYNF